MPYKQSEKQAAEADVNKRLEAKLNGVMFEVIRSLPLGASNREEDKQRTSTWSRAQYYQALTGGEYVKRAQGEAIPVDQLKANGRQINLETGDAFSGPGFLGKEPNRKGVEWQWHYHAPPASGVTVLDFEFGGAGDMGGMMKFTSLAASHQKLLVGATKSQQLGWGNCHDRADLCAKLLWENPADINRIEVIVMDDFDHVLVLVNRAEDSTLDDPSTFGETCYAVDAWHGSGGEVFKGTEFKERIAETEAYFIAQGLETNKPGAKSSHTFTVADEIKPATHGYPSGKPHLTIDTNIVVDDHRFEKPFNSTAGKLRAEHQQKMKGIMGDMKERLASKPVGKGYEKVEERREAVQAKMRAELHKAAGSPSVDAANDPEEDVGGAPAPPGVSGI